MAHVPVGTRVETQITVADPTLRVYPYDFPVAAAEDVAVEYNGVAVPPSQFVVTVNPGRTGGTVRFPDIPEIAVPLTLAANGQLHIYRDTEVRRRTSFGTGGFAGAVAVETMAAYLTRVLEELAARVETHERVIAGEDEIRRIAQELIAQAQAGEGGLFSIGLDDLNTALRGLVNRFSLADQAELDGTTLTLYTAEAVPHHIELEELTRGISIEDEHDTLISGFRSVKTIKAAGNSADGGPYFTVDGDTATLHVAGLSAGGGQPSSTDTDHDLNPLDLTDTPLVSNTTIATGTTAGVWTGWHTLFTSGAIAAEDVGVVAVEAVLRGEAVTASSGGGDRIYVESRIVRTRATNDVAMDWDIVYVRNLNQGQATPQGLADASQILEKSYSIWDDAEEGDTYKVEVRVISQVASRSVQFSTDSKLEVVTGANVASITTTDTTGGGGGTITPRTDQEIETLINANEKVLRGEALDTTLRGMVSLATNASVQVVQSPSAYRIGPLNDHLRVPTDTGDYEIEVRVGTGAWQRWDLATLLALPAINQSDMLDDSNSLSWTEAGTTYRIAHDNQGFFGFTSDIGTYSVSMRGLPILLRAGMLPSASATAAGIIGSADWQKIQDAINAGVFDLPAAITNAALDTSDRLLVSDQSEAAGSRLKGLPISELDARYQAAGAGGSAPNAVELDTSAFTSGDAGSFPTWNGASAWEEGSFATSDIEWMYANGEWTAQGFRTLDALPTGTLVDNLPVGTLRFLRGHGIYEIQPDSGGTATIELAPWTPVHEQSSDNYGWDSDSARTFGTVPVGLTQGVVDPSGAVTTPGFISLFRDSSNRVWLEATAGYFSQSGMVVTPESGSPWHLAYNETTDGVDQFFSGTSTTAPWTTSPVTLTIHALGGATPFTSGGKHWTLVSPIPRPLPAWLQADTPRPATQPPVVATLPFPLTTGARYITTEVSREQPVFDVTLTAGGNNDPIRTTFDVPDSGTWTLTRYSAALTLAAAVRSQLVLGKPSAETRTPLAIWIGSTRYNLGSELSSAHDNQFVIQAAPATAVGDDLEIVLVFSANPHENEPAEVDIQPGDWTATGPYAVIGTPGTAAPWAQAGQPRPRLALDTLLDGTGAGVSTTSTGGANVQTSLEIFSPAFDLDDSDNQNGLVFVEVTARLHSKSDALISFGASAASAADVVDEMRIRGWVSLADIRALGDYTTSGMANAVRVGLRLDVWLSGGRIADVRYYLAHNTDNELGRFKLINNRTGTSSFSVSFHELVFVEANEAGGVGGGVQLATDEQAAAGTLNTRAVTPKQVSDRMDGHKIEVLTTAQYTAIGTDPMQSYDANTIYIAT